MPTQPCRPDQSFIKLAEIVALSPIANGVLNGKIGTQSTNRTAKTSDMGLSAPTINPPAAVIPRSGRQSDDNGRDQSNRSQRDPQYDQNDGTRDGAIECRSLVTPGNCCRI